MVYVALLRGVNVGGKSRVDMRELKTLFEASGLRDVRTYINSGNVIFDTDRTDVLDLQRDLEDAMEARFGFRTAVLVRSSDEIAAVVEALPAEWTNDSTQKCDVIFLWPEVDDPSVLERLTWDAAVEDVRYTPGAVLRRIDRKHAARSRLTRIVGTPLYASITIRNCNTARKLLELTDR